MLFSFQLSAQNKSDLENKKKQLHKEIRQTESLLQETKKNKKLSLVQLVTLNKKISIRQQLITTIQGEVGYLAREIQKNQQLIDKLQSDLEKLKQEYARMIYFAQRNQDTYSRMMYVFSSRDFNQAYRRLKYLQQYSDYRRKQALIIQQTQALLAEKIRTLQAQKGEKVQLLGVEEVEKNNLAKEKTEQETVLGQLQEKEKELMTQLKQKEQEQKKLQQAIQKLIEAEIRKSRELAKKAGKAEEPRGLTLTPEAQKLSSSFEMNRGKFPWPVVEGVITGHFGQQPHPVLKGVTVNNNGVDIATKKDSPVRSVFQGEVTGVASVPGYGQVVMVRHGQFLTVYSNLRDVFVKVGDKLNTKQNIGVVDTDENGKSEVHFEIWKGGSNVLNPEAWILPGG